MSFLLFLTENKIKVAMHLLVIASVFISTKELRSCSHLFDLKNCSHHLASWLSIISSSFMLAKMTSLPLHYHPCQFIYIYIIYSWHKYSCFKVSSILCGSL